MEQLTKIVREPGDKVPLYVRIYEQLFQLIEMNYFKVGEKLPGENTLSKQLGVSRASIRQALLILQEDGIIQCIQGKGNFLIKAKKSIEIGLEKVCNVAKTFHNDEYEEISIEVNYEMPGKWIQTVLGLKQNMLVVVFHRTYKMNNEYVSYSVTVIPYEYLIEYNLDMDDKNGLSMFLDQTIYESSASAKTDIKVTAAGDFIADKLKVADGTALMLFEEVMYKDSGEPFVILKSYFRPEFYEFHINRRKL